MLSLVTNPTTSLQEMLVEVLDLQKVWTSSNTDKMKERGLLVRKGIPQALTTEVTNLGSGKAYLRVEGSDGSGSKTRVPWVRLFDPKHSPKPTAGW
jgi:hypothetical protein